MSKSYYFKHPQPLSPSKRAKAVERDGVLVQKDKSVRGGYKRVKGVYTTQSIYYLWFEYLKRSKKYKKACGYEVEMTEAEEKDYKAWREFKGSKKRKSTEQVLNDFGDIFKYKTDSNGFTDAHDFYKNWWEKRGVKCFGVRGADMDTAVTELSTAKDVLSLGSDIDDYEIVLLPKSMPRTLMRKRVGKLISGMPTTITKQKEADYPIVSDRVDVESLRDCLAIYDMMIDDSNNYTAVEVYAQLFSIKAKHKHLDLFTDTRSERGMLRDYVCDYDLVSKDQIDDKEIQDAASAYARKKMKWRETQRVASTYDDGKGDFFTDTRALTEKEKEKLEELYYGKYLKILVKSPLSEERAKAKNYYKQQVFRLLRKAKANIEAVEKGEFGVGH